MKKLLIIILLFSISGLLVFFFTEKGDFIKQGNLYINEIVASNNYTHASKDGNYYDYIELYNGNDYAVNLSGYRLADSMAEINKWHFGNIEIEPHEYLIIYASKKDSCTTKDDCHTNFKLKSAGETLLLADSNGNIINKVRYPELINDVAYSFYKGKYVVTLPTPGNENTEKEIKKVNIRNVRLKINEYMTHNKSSTYASDGGYYDWIELYNDSDKEIEIFGLSLSDDENNLNKFRLPIATIPARGYKVIYLTGGINIENEICANFKLSDNDQKIILSGNGKIIDEVKIIPLEDNVSYGLKDKKWLYFYTPTPGGENNTYGIEGVSE